VRLKDANYQFESSENSSDIAHPLTPALPSRTASWSGRSLPLRSRIAYLAGLLSCELVIISIWLDSASLSGGVRLVALVHDWGAWAVRVGVAFFVSALFFAASRTEGGVPLLAGKSPDRPVVWHWIVAHSGGMAVFLGLSWFLFNTHPAGILADLTAAFWLGVGVFGGIAAALAFVPGSIWLETIRNNKIALVYGLTTGIVAFLLGISAWRLWLPLSRMTFAVARAILHPFMPGLLSDPSTLSIGSQTFMVTIAPECSGYEGIGLVLAFAAAWLWFLRPEWRFPQALLLLPAGATIMWVFNCLRIAALILIGHAGAVRVALGGFHSQAGWIAFTAVTIGLCLGARRVAWMTNAQTLGALRSEDVAHNLATPYLVPFLAVLATALISRGASAGFEWLYPLRVLVAVGTLWCFRRSYQKLDWHAGWLAVVTGVAVSCIWIALDVIAGGQAFQGIPDAFSRSSPFARFTWLAFRVFGAVVAAPITEELAYRGFLMRRLISRSFESVSWARFSWIAIIISSVAYGALFGRQWLGGTIAGCLFALVLVWRGRIGEAVAAHSVANGIVAVWVIVSGNWRIW